MNLIEKYFRWKKDKLGRERIRGDTIKFFKNLDDMSTEEIMLVLDDWDKEASSQYTVIMMFAFSKVSSIVPPSPCFVTSIKIT